MKQGCTSHKPCPITIDNVC